MSTRSILAVFAGALALVGCGTPPPASQVPSPRAALDRLHATQGCGIGVQSSSKIDYFGKDGRIRSDLLGFAVWPAKLRLDVVSPFGVALAVLTSDGDRFALSDLRDRRFLQGPASACNIARLTTIEMPGHVLVSMLRGEAPVLKHADGDASIAWDKSGYYVVKIKSSRLAEEEIHLAPHPDDFGLPWEKQRFRLLDVVVKQEGWVLYHAEMDEHAPALMGSPRVDPDNIDPPIPTSGPQCTAEVPRRIHVEVPGMKRDVRFRYEKVVWNPPLDSELFAQKPAPGLEMVRVDCDKDGK